MISAQGANKSRRQEVVKQTNKSSLMFRHRISTSKILHSFLDEEMTDQGMECELNKVIIQ